jgi:excinuclease UvrABC ATPase subunit
MDRYLLQEQWASMIRNLKDSEKQYDIPAYTTEQMAQAILRYIRYTRIRQYTLFQQKRGEEFEKMVGRLKADGYSEEAIQRYLEDEELWKTTLTLGEQ